MPGEVKIYRNEDVDEIVACIPEGHRHVRIVLKLRDQTIVLQEATVAAIVRAYVAVALHPTRRCMKLVKHIIEGAKPGFAKAQLVEVEEGDRCSDPLTQAT
ncbi:hypothetical protein [Desulfurococcus mucosus]|uniref:hypothetical protein n=1 Tax=Desulfurococcus mucosus TaxID=2275 RepID=UPI00064E69A1|nr:hypothetical protein [Desulfurococcus mucosus]